MKFLVLRVDPPAFPQYWKAPTIFLEKVFFVRQVLQFAVERRKGHCTVLHSSMTPGSVSNSQTPLKKRILPSEMET